VGVFIYLLTENNEFYKIDTRDRSIKKSEAEFEENFSGAGIDFTLSLREKSLYSQG
jgi:(p)ppGpp synthase/HD superfamily hydrolase